jgi:glycosyltransferase involved in cell wall biosynthesis
VDKPVAIVLGQTPPPYIGPAVATEILLRSSLRDRFSLIHLNTNVHEDISTLEVWSIDKVLKNINLYLRLASLILRHRPELVFIPISQKSAGFFKDSFFVFISRLLGKKTLLQLRGSNFRNWVAGSSSLTKWYVRFVIKRAQGIVVLGQNLRYLFSDYFEEGQIFVVPNGANIPLKPVSRSGSSAVILYLSNLLASKGIEDVVEAAVQLRETPTLEFRFEIVGAWQGAGTKDAVLRAAQREALPLRFHPPTGGEGKFAFLQSADIFVFPPREPEGHPWVIVEAMAAGLPIITTDQGAITESVIDGVNGFIVEKRSPRQIAEKIKYLIEHPDVRKKMGEESRRLYLENFTEEKMVERLSFAFHRVLGY